MSGALPPLTTLRRLEAGAVLRHGASSAYRAVEVIDGEPHLVRDDFQREVPAAAPVAALDGLAFPPPGPEVARGPGPAGGGAGRPLACLVHITDLQLADVQSPTRFEFLNRYFADPRYAGLVPVQRPQEAVNPHAVEATLRTINGLHGPVTGHPLQLAITTGDAIDNAQWNEVQLFLALFDGGAVQPNSGAPDYAGVQAVDWPDDIFWKPDGIGHGGPDIFRREFGFPHWPGLLEAALRPFTSPGLAVPWLSCFGNHEALNQGVGAATPGLAVALTGDRKPVALPDGFDPDHALELFTVRPETFMAGPSRTVPPDLARRPVTRREFVAAHFHPRARPAGHGFTERNRLDGTAYYVHDTPAVRFIALDTNCLAGGADGCLDWTQAHWLEQRLAEVHSTYRGPDGQVARASGEDRLVVLFSHHGADTLTNTRGARPGPGGEPLLPAGDLLALLHRFPNVVLWLNGHTHTNAIRARRDPADPRHGFWEVTTCAVIDWPCQTRIVELTDRGGELSIVCTMVDHDTPLAPRSLQTGADLAALHRELAANIPFDGPHPGRSGRVSDRNVDLRLPAPFPLSRLATA